MIYLFLVFVISINTPISLEVLAGALNDLVYRASVITMGF